MPASEEKMGRAIAEACLALRRRSAAEEGAHSPALSALSRALSSQGTELQGKVDSLQQELSQSYRVQAQVSEQLVHEVSSAETMRLHLSEKESLIGELQKELDICRKRMEVLESELATKSSALDVAVFEMASLRSQVEELENKLAKAEAENRQLIDRWMLQKMQDAEKLNEANAMYEDMMERLKSSRLEEFARQQVDGIVRHSEAGAEHYMKLGAPTSVRHTVRAHEGGCSAVQFEHHSSVLMTGGNDLVVKFWDSVSATCVNALRGTVGSILDLAISFDNNLVLGACSDNKVYQWDVQSGRIRHILTGHTEKVCTVDFSKATSRRAVSAAYDRTIKSWDLVTGYCTNTTICFSNCNSLCLTSDGLTLCSGHVDGNMRFWDLRSGKLANEVAAHSQGITSVSISHGGFMILTSGRDNVLNMFDLRTLEVCDSFRAAGYRVPTNWNRSAMSADERYVASGSVDGGVYVWRRDTHEVEVVLKAHTCPVLTCCWSDVSKSLATGDKNGSVCLWE